MQTFHATDMYRWCHGIRTALNTMLLLLVFVQLPILELMQGRLAA